MPTSIQLIYDDKQAVGAFQRLAQNAKTSGQSVDSFGQSAAKSKQQLDAFANSMVAANQRQQAAYDQSILASRGINTVGGASGDASKSLGQFRENLAKTGAAGAAMTGLMGGSGEAISRVAAVTVNAAAVIGTFSAQLGFVGLAVSGTIAAIYGLGKAFDALTKNWEKLHEIQEGAVDDLQLLTNYSTELQLVQARLTRTLEDRLAIQTAEATLLQSLIKYEQDLAKLEMQSNNTNEERAAIWERRKKIQEETFKESIRLAQESAVAAEREKAAIKDAVAQIRERDKAEHDRKSDEKAISGSTDEVGLQESINRLYQKREQLLQSVARNADSAFVQSREQAKQDLEAVAKIDEMIDRRQQQIEKIGETEAKNRDEERKAQEEAYKKEIERIKLGQQAEEIRNRERLSQKLADVERENSLQHELDVINKRNDISERDREREKKFIEERNKYFEKLLGREKDEEKRKEIEFEREKAHWQDRERAAQRELDLARQKAEEEKKAQDAAKERIQKLLDLDKQRAQAQPAAQQQQQPLPGVPAPQGGDGAAADPFAKLGPFARAQLGIGGPLTGGQQGPIGRTLFDPFRFAAEADIRTRQKIRAAHERLPQIGGGGAAGAAEAQAEAAGPEDLAQQILARERAKVSEKDIRGRVSLLRETEIARQRAAERMKQFGGLEPETREDRKAQAAFDRETRQQIAGERRRIERRGDLTGGERAEAERFFGDQAKEAAKEQIDLLQKQGVLDKDQVKLAKDLLETVKKQADEIDQVKADHDDVMKALGAFIEAQGRKRAQRAARGN